MNNVSKFEDRDTAHTQEVVAYQRAKTLQTMNKKNVLELCVGPSLKILEKAYSSFNITVSGNDIEYRWKQFYPKGKWFIGDCFNIDWSSFDAIVFAPPLSKGCSGKREDALMIEEVSPSYYKFIDRMKAASKDQLAGLVLPARCLATREDRKQYHKLTSYLYSNGFHFKVNEMKDNKQIRKYVDIYFKRNE